MIDEDGVDVGPTVGELERFLGAAVVKALQAYLEAEGLSIVRLPEGGERTS